MYILNHYSPGVTVSPLVSSSPNLSHKPPLNSPLSPRAYTAALTLSLSRARESFLSLSLSLSRSLCRRSSAANIYWYSV